MSSERILKKLFLCCFICRFKVTLGSNAQLSAYGSNSSDGTRSGGIIQISSDYDVENFCEEKLGAKTNGEANEPLRNIRGLCYTHHSSLQVL